MKRLTQTLAFCLLTAFTAVAQKNYVSEVWVSDLGNGKYKNPVLYADYSDPDACRVGDDFYMTSSSFNCLPGLQILHSKDLVNWTIIGAAVPNALTPIETPERPEHGNRVWAPAIRHHNGEFYIFWGDPDQGAFMVKAKDPKGPWSENEDNTAWFLKEHPEFSLEFQRQIFPGEAGSLYPDAAIYTDY